MKALVLKTQGDRAAVLLTDGSFRVARGQFSVGETFDYLVAAKPTLRQLVATAAAMIAMLGAAAGWWVDRNYVPYAEISLDVNPSIVYSVNKRDRVLSVSAVNDDAKNIVETLKQEGVQFASVPDAVGRTLSLLEDEGYLDESKPDYVLVNVSADDEARQDSIVTQVESAMRKLTDSNPTVEYRIERSDRETAREAEDSGMSPGRYAAWKAAVEAGPEEADPRVYGELTVREIIEAAPGDEHEPKAPVGESPAQEEPTAPAEAPAGEAENPREADLQPEPTERESAPAEPDRQNGAAGEAAPSQEDKAESFTPQEVPAQQERPVQGGEETHQPDSKAGDTASKSRDKQPESTSKENARKEDPGKDNPPQDRAAVSKPKKEDLPGGDHGQAAQARDWGGDRK